MDSAVLLDLVARATGPASLPGQIVVAHFDHGIRANSAADAEFVKKLAKKYKVPFELGKGSLGEQASEEEARQARYGLLRQLQKKHAPAEIVTAHHQDDLVETIAMNLVRGTGWRGLAPMSANLQRPLLDFSKVELVNYAIRNNLDWIEDETNYTEKYFRNRIRSLLLKMTPEQRREVLLLNAKQRLLRDQIERALKPVKGVDTLKRKFLLGLPAKVAVEVLRSWTDERLTEKQVKKLLKDIKDASGGIDLQPGGGLEVKLRRGELRVNKLRSGGVKRPPL